jgi:hypothetical protein
MVYAIAEDEIVQLEDRLLQMVGNAKTFQLNAGESIAQLASPPPGRMTCPRNKNYHRCNRKNESD